jgi:hypothetical protein
MHLYLSPFMLYFFYENKWLRQFVIYTNLVSYLTTIKKINLKNLQI